MSAFAFILLFLVVVVTVIVVVTAVLGGMMGPSFNRFNPFLPRSAASPAAGPDPACGSCGYATRGISTFECPECGADLREVGIVTPNMRRPVGAGCLLPTVFTGAVLVAAFVLLPILGRFVPQHEAIGISQNLRPNSGEYVNVQIEIDASATTTAAGPSSPGNSNSTGSSYSSSGGTQTTVYTVSWGSLQPPAQIDALRLTITPDTNATAWRDGWIDIDPQNLSFTWLDPQGRPYTGTAPLTQPDMLAFLKACGADDTQPAVQDEAKELFALVDGLGQGMHQFRFNTFNGGGGGMSFSSMPSPYWAGGYLGVWMVIWIAGLIWIGRRRSKRDRN